MDIFPLKSDDGRPAGSLQISMRWKHPFRRSRELGPRSLSATEVESLISTFSAGEMHEGLVGYKDFCRFVDPPRDVLRTMERLRTYSQKMYEKENLKSRELFRVLLDLKSEEETFKEEAFTQVRSSPLLLSPVSLPCSYPLLLSHSPLPCSSPLLLSHLCPCPPEGFESAVRLRACGLHQPIPLRRPGRRWTAHSESGEYCSAANCQSPTVTPYVPLTLTFHPSVPSVSRRPQSGRCRWSVCISPRQAAY